MKICPICRTTYDDDGLNFCLEDGSVLTFTSPEAAPTVVMNHPRVTSPSPGPGVRTSLDAQNAGSYSLQPKKKSSKTWLWVLGIFGLLILLCGGGFAALFIYVASVANSNSISNSTKGTTNSTNTKSNTFTSGTPNASPGSTTAEAREVDLAELVKESSIYGKTEFKDGELLMASNEKGYYYVLVLPDDFKTEGARTRVTVRNPDDADSDLGYGLIFHSKTTPLESDYAFLIDAKRRRFRVVRHEPEDEITVTPWTSSTLINTGTAANTLEALDKGDKIELYVNGQIATTITNKRGPKTGVPGLYSGDGVKIGFSEMQIAK